MLQVVYDGHYSLCMAQAEGRDVVGVGETTDAYLLIPVTRHQQLPTQALQHTRHQQAVTSCHVGMSSQARDFVTR